MRNRGFRILFLCFLAIWFGGIVPGHPRGMIQLPGAVPRSCHAPAKQEAASHCCSTGKTDQSDESDGPTQQEKGRCAVCYYVLTLSTPPVVDLDIKPLGLLPVVFADRIEQSSSLQFIPVRPSRAPPAV